MSRGERDTGNRGIRDDGNWLAGVEPIEKPAEERLHGGPAWYYMKGHESFGPVTRPELCTLARLGHISKETAVYAEHIRGWVRADSVRGLFDAGQEGPAAAAEPVATPMAGTPPELVATTEYADFLARLGATIIDEAIVLAAVLFAAGVTSGLSEPYTRFLDAHFVGTVVVTELPIAWLYYALMESSRWQATVGKRAMRILVTDRSGYRISFGRASARFAASLVSRAAAYLGYFVPDPSGRERTLHDMIAGTVVVSGV